MSELRNTSLGNTAAPAGWYPDPHGLPQQRWWAGDQWTHAVAPSVAEPERAPQVTMQAAPRETFALPATPSPQQEYPTRRQLREQAAREAAAAVVEPHPAAPFEMPAAPAESPVPVVAVQPIPAPVAATPVAVAPMTATPAPVAAPVTFQPTIMPSPAYAPPQAAAPLPAAALPASAFPPPMASQQVFVPPVAAVAPAAQPAWAQPVAAQPLFVPPQQVALPAAAPLALAATASESSWPFQTPPGGGFDAPAEVPYQPFGMKQSVKAGVSAPPDRVQTWAAWAMAVLPLVIVAVGFVVVSQLSEFYTVFMQGGLLFIFALITVLLAVQDRRILVIYGHTRTASPAWVLLTPLVYLFVRSSKARGSAGRESAPLLVWLLCAAAIVGLAFLFPDWLAKFVATVAVA